MGKLVIRDKKSIINTSEIGLVKSVINIGKLAENDIVLERINISRRHCRIMASGNSVKIMDLGSRNGTYLNGKKVNPNNEYSIKHADAFKVGDFTFTYFEKDDEKLKSQLFEVPKTPEEMEDVILNPNSSIPIDLKRQIHNRLLDELDIRHMDFDKYSEEELKTKTVKTVWAILREPEIEIPTSINRERLVKEVVDEALGLGPLEDLIDDETVDEIMVNSFDTIYVERKGRIEKTNLSFMNNNAIIACIRRILAPIGRRVDESSPMVDARLRDGSRVNAIIPPLAITGPTLTIRKFSKVPFTVSDIMGFGTITGEMAEFMKLAVANRKNCAISGGTGSGKTTLLNIISGFVSNRERIVTIEDAAELKLPQDHVISLEARPPNLEGKGAIPIRKLVINSLRMRPDRIIVGECRGGEALDMLQAMNTGHDGSLTTLHANSPRDALSRLETLVLMAGVELPVRAIRDQISSAIEIIIQQSRMPDGTRKVTAITEITGMEGDVITMQDIFTYNQKGFDQKGRVEGHHRATGAIPKFVHELRKRGIKVNMDIFR